MEITEREAQLILDALAWELQTWTPNGFQGTIDPEVVKIAREDFVQFCKDRGIESVVRVK
jgi:hypothetical protein